MTAPPRRPRESDAAYTARVHSWTLWSSQEPNVDLWCIDDTEVAEYRAWAGTRQLHENRVNDLIRIAGDT